MSSLPESPAAVHRAAVIGTPVAHSLSPAIFAELARVQNLPVQYERIDAGPDDFRVRVERARAGGFLGFNVTMPHKAAAAALAGVTSTDVRVLGAANVLHFTGGRIVAHNTDVAGFADALAAAGVRLGGEATVVVYGAGGAAAAVVLACARAGAGRIAIVNRTRERASRLARAMAPAAPRTQIVASTADDLDGTALYVNATPAGDPFRRPVPGAVAIDLAYRPLTTPFMVAAKTHGLAAHGGLAMLVGQALATYEIWFGPLPDRKRAARDLLEHVERLA